MGRAFHSPHEIGEEQNSTDPNHALSRMHALRCLQDGLTPRNVLLVDVPLGLLRVIHCYPLVRVVNLNPAIDDGMLRGK